MLKPAEYAAAGVPCLLAGRDRPLVELVAIPARRRGLSRRRLGERGPECTGRALRRRHRRGGAVGSVTERLIKVFSSVGSRS